MHTNERHELKPYRLLLSLPILVVVFLSSCQKPSITFGNSFVSNNNTNIVAVDTSTLQFSTILLDSFVTEGSGSMILGRYNDPYFGTITSKTFFQLGTPGKQVVTNMAGFDSIEFVMRINKAFYADTTVVQRYYVSQLDNVINYPSATQRFFYNNSSLPYNPVPLGSTDVVISPLAVHTSQNALDSVRIRLPDTLGQRLLNMFVNNSDTITNLNTFLSYFRGLAVYSDTGASHIGTIFGFRDTVFMRLYYHEPGVITNYKHIDFPYNNKSFQFNNITADRSNSPLAVLSSLQSSRPNPLIPVEAPSSLTNNAVYVQGPTGIQTKIRFPYISNLLNVPDYIGVLKAQLILTPIAGTFNPELALPPQMILSATDQNNELGTVIYFNGQVQYGNLVTDYVYGENTLYSYDITAYIKQLLTLGSNNTDGLILNVPSPASETSFNRVVFGDNTNKNYKITLKIYYISLVH